MPFIQRDELEGMQSELAELREFKETHQEFEPFIPFAVKIRDEIMNRLEDPFLPVGVIMDEALAAVTAEEYQQARSDLVVRYAHERREDLYAQVIKRVEETEGPQIYAEVVTQMEGNPQLMLDLMASAREEVAARAKEDVNATITQEQQAIIEKEAKRQLQLDRLDLHLSVERRLQLNSQEVTEVLEAGDRLVLFYGIENYSGNRELTLEWTEDVNGHTGWVLVEAGERLYVKNPRPNTIPSEFPVNAGKFVEVGSMQRDLREGKDIFTVNELVLGFPIQLVQYPAKGKVEPLGSARGGSFYNLSALTLEGSDFQTKSLDFRKTN